MSHILSAMTAAFQDDRTMDTQTYRKLMEAAREATTNLKHPAPTMLLQAGAGPVPCGSIPASATTPPAPLVRFEDQGEAFEARFHAGRKTAKADLATQREVKA